MNNTFRPKENERYYFYAGRTEHEVIDEIKCTTWGVNPELDEHYYEVGNCFKTREDAEVEVDKAARNVGVNTYLKCLVRTAKFIN